MHANLQITRFDADHQLLCLVRTVAKRGCNETPYKMATATADCRWNDLIVTPCSSKRDLGDCESPKRRASNIDGSGEDKGCMRKI